MREMDGRKVALAAAGVGIGLGALQRLRQENLRGKVVLITGSSRGLGFLLAREFAREGCGLALCARDGGELERARQELRREGAEVLAVPCDIADRSQVDALVERVNRHFGRVDVLVNNAGVIQVGPVESMTVSDYQEAMDIMFWGALYPTLAVLPQMLERQDGRIVNITSIGGKVSVPHLLPYSCAKFAHVALSEGLRAELSPQGIDVLTVVPGLMRTGSYQNAYFKGRQGREFTWFALGASLPGISMDAERAARRIVTATKRGETELILTGAANALARFHGLFPAATAHILDMANRTVLPSPDGGVKDRARGEEVDRQLHSSLLDALTAWGLSAAERFNEYPGPKVPAR